MLTPARHLVHQRSMLVSLGNVAVDSVLDRFKPAPRAGAVPGPELSARVAAPPNALIDDFLKHVGADPSRYAGVVPPQLFPQWGLPLALKALRGCGFPLVKMINGGCRLESNAPLRRGEELTVRARLTSVNRDGRRAVLCQRVVTEQPGAPNALVAEVYGIVRESAARAPAAQGTRQPAYLPASARKLQDWTLEREAGLDFALLTGDFNPLHWLLPYARAMGFASTILHGFAAMARAYSGLERVLSPQRLSMLDVRFVRPITLPARVSLYVDGERVFVGTADEPVYVTGSFEST
jgi:acyl dehydratase